jgi:hypothetical protein
MWIAPQRTSAIILPVTYVPSALVSFWLPDAAEKPSQLRQRRVQIAPMRQNEILDDLLLRQV